MTEGKSDGSTNPSAVRIRDNQRRSRARHKEYVEGLQRKLQDYERRGVEATLEMQQAARNVALENSRLRMLLGYHGVTNDEVDKFLQAFPDQPAAEAAKAIVAQSASSQQLIAPIAPKVPIQPLSRSPSIGPVHSQYVAPSVNREGNTREVLDAIVGIKRDSRLSDASTSSMVQSSIATEPRQPLLQPQPQPPTLPILPALVLGQARPDPHSVDRLSVLASASIHQDHGNGRHHRVPSGADNLHVPSPPNVGQSPPSSNVGTPVRLSSASPSQGRRSRSPLETSTAGRHGANTEIPKPNVVSEGHDETLVRSSAISRILDKP